MMRIYAWDEVDVAGMFQLIQDGRMEEFEEVYNEILYNYPSYYDLKNENSYHVLMLGSVSYTHLDVYKRQVYTLINYCAVSRRY